MLSGVDDRERGVNRLTARFFCCSRLKKRRIRDNMILINKKLSSFTGKMKALQKTRRQVHKQRERRKTGCFNN
ncbi:hypothetical protein CHM34_03945 [Paludifilum halophilum]|uniref:Uncharacterized protein n=1 Tax=Paludifilum halophilum TaxID=1642702 RepID=A0A235BAD0_9BACL|nr:hypothetical protein CHM34_03945 [Paludifilum halophilum]